MAATMTTVATPVSSSYNASTIQQRTVMKSNPPPSRSYSKKAKSTKSRLDAKGKSPFHARKRLSEDYEKPRSGREDWWRATIKETPGPGSYETRDFVHDLRLRPNTYSFKTDGRKINPQPQIGKGEHLLPGAYEYEDLASHIDKYNGTYAFRDTSRDDKDFLNFGVKDKDVNVAPNAYEVEKHLQIHADKLPSKHFMFKSQAQRFPTIHFKPKDGPAPGNYDYSAPGANHVVSSSFKSKTPRFPTSHTKVPGPGTYASTLQTEDTVVLSKMGRIHGVFFPSAFQP